MNDKVISFGNSKPVDMEAVDRRRVLIDWVVAGIERFEQETNKEVTSLMAVMVADDGHAHMTYHTELSALTPTACLSIAVGTAIGARCAP